MPSITQVVFLGTIYPLDAAAGSVVARDMTAGGGKFGELSSDLGSIETILRMLCDVVELRDRECANWIQFTPATSQINGLAPYCKSFQVKSQSPADMAECSNVLFDGGTGVSTYFE
jgi:hypothetical protein